MRRSTPSLQTGLRRLTDTFSAKRARFAPDGRRIVFDGRFRPTLFDFDVFVANADGSALRRVTRGPARDLQPAWSPDGRTIAFSRERRGQAGIPVIWIVRIDGRGARRLVDGVGPIWSPDGGRIAFGTPGGLHVVDRNGARRTRVTPFAAEPAAWVRGKLLVTGWKNNNADVYVVNEDGRGLRRLTSAAGEDLAGDWSPDGSRVLFTSDRAGNRDVYVMDADGARVRKLTQHPGDDWATDWATAAP